MVYFALCLSLMYFLFCITVPRSFFSACSLFFALFRGVSGFPFSGFSRFSLYYFEFSFVPFTFRLVFATALTGGDCHLLLYILIALSCFLLLICAGVYKFWGGGCPPFLRGYSGVVWALVGASVGGGSVVGPLLCSALFFSLLCSLHCSAFCSAPRLGWGEVGLGGSLGGRSLGSRMPCSLASCT